MHNLEKEAKEFMKKRKQTFNIMDDVIKSLENVNKNLETILKKIKDLNAKNNTHT